MLTLRITGQVGTFAIDADISAGLGVTALVGPSGAGKTTLLRAIAGLWTPEVGRINVGERVYFDSEAGINLPPQERKLGVVFQDPLLFPHLSVERNLMFGAGKNPVGREGVLDLLDLGGLLDRMPRHLSGGEAQRVALGRALLADPHLILLDEPLTGLDDERRLTVLPFLERLRDESDVPIVYVSHHRDEVSRLADLVFLIDQGQVIGEQTPTEYMRARGKLDDRIENGQGS
ncbi:MAG: ATP-binding cassette domain-containing protein [Pseudomonadota bacterium]